MQNHQTSQLLIIHRYNLDSGLASIFQVQVISTTFVDRIPIWRRSLANLEPFKSGIAFYASLNSLYVHCLLFYAKL
jgi:hypothetical protein